MTYQSLGADRSDVILTIGKVGEKAFDLASQVIDYRTQKITSRDIMAQQQLELQRIEQMKAQQQGKDNKAIIIGSVGAAAAIAITLIAANM